MHILITLGSATSEINWPEVISKHPTILSTQIAAASLIFLVSIATMGIVGFSKIQDITHLAMKESKEIACTTALNEVGRVLSEKGLSEAETANWQMEVQKGDLAAEEDQ